VDALLVLLPLLERGRGQQGAASLFKDAEELLSLADWPHARLLEPLALSQLAAVCDAKQVGGQAYYRLNDDKVWVGVVGGQVVVGPHTPQLGWDHTHTKRFLLLLGSRHSYLFFLHRMALSC
jgi:hypothetical protein